MKKLLLLTLSFAVPVLAAPSAQVFDAVKKPESLDAQWRARLCALLPQPCDVQQLGLYRPRGAAPGDYVVLSAEPLAMARIKRSTDAAGWQLDRLHDFSGYAQSLKKDSGAEQPEARLSLAPALYPLAEGKWAVAVLQTVSEMYSGGGASFDTADFVPLEGGKAVHEDIPFSCFKMIRACFSEKEYKTSKHCHDESNGSLRIAYGEAAKPGAPYEWQYTWLQSKWPQNEPQSVATTTRIRFTAKTTERADFCGGPQ
ncbi:hypothetical protein PMI12_01376 [Variovorax sp. CF313]|jgi:hypothetical protein|uniref:hypothetical protein n=1 Tax=Variovorax sp. CF313 TaxID=1144315 RepID=UPI00027118B5|nr:hypothetical protein [Variovorax sp. CF313]EJL78115.1 hypothetical protein PMI12_01376 [Variovorax sp. CF313]